MTRNIVVNGRFLSREITGVERYGREILSMLGGRCRVELTDKNGIRGHFWEQMILPGKLDSNTLLWSPANTGPVLFRNQALTIHDLSPLEHPEWFTGFFSIWYRLFVPILIARVKLIFTPSEFVRMKIMRRFSVNQVVVTSNAVNTGLFHKGADGNRIEKPKKYILFVGSLQLRKNLQSLLNSWRILKDEFPDYWLVVVGDTFTVFRQTNYAKDERVHFLGYISDEDLAEVYTNAALFVLPSYDEGFGLSALEAMACGAPVIVSNGGALPEVVGDAAYIFDLDDQQNLTKAIRKVLIDKHLQNELRQMGFARVQEFSWASSAEIIWKALHEI